jgi:serine/threonine protein kinase
MSRVPEECDSDATPLESNLIDALDRLVDAIQADDREAGDRLLVSEPELAEFIGCLSRLEALVPATVVFEPRDVSGLESESGRTLGVGESESDSSGDRIGTRFGRYELLERIGRGAMGVVYLARQTDLDRTVALKLVTPGRMGAEVDVARFHSEARAAARLRHPGIVGVLEVGEFDGQHFIAMDYVAGGSLEQQLVSESYGADARAVGSDDSVLLLTSPAGLWRRSSAGNRVEPDMAAGWVSEIARAVDHLHNHGIVHRDLKPANILLDEEQRPLVTDFGLALVRGDAATSIAGGTIVGTPAYMAPEQAAGDVESISPRSDIFSLGVILYELITGRAPFGVSNPLDTLVRVLEVDPELPTSLEPWLSRELEHICLKCLEKDPANRYDSASELADDLERYLRRENVQARPGGVIHRFRRWGRRQPVLLAHLVALGLAAGINQVGFLIGGDSESPGVHLRVMSILAGWMVLSVVCQWLLRGDRVQGAVRFGWCAADAGLLTAVLAQNSVPPGPILVGYPLLIVASGLFFRVRLVWFMTLSCVVGYAVLLGVRRQQFADTLPGEPPWQYPIIFAAGLAVMGTVVAYQVFRVRVLSRYYRRAGRVE